jgi:hypothetical protein
VTGLLIAVSAAVALALFLATRAGEGLAERVGLPPLRGRAPRQDREFLRERICGGDRSAARARLAAERSRAPEANDAELHRRAIRTWFREQEERGA